MADSLPKMLHALKNANINYNIKLRCRKTSNTSPYLLYLDYIHQGKRKTKSLGIAITGDRKNKIRDDNQLKKALQIRQKFQTKYDQNPESFSFEDTRPSDFIEFYKQTSTRKSDKNYRLSYNKFLDFYKDNFLNFNKIDYALCEDFKEYLINLKIKNHTAKHYFTCFKTCLNDALKRGHIDKNPAKGILIRYERKSVERLYDTELKALWNTPCEYHDLKNGFLFSCYTGLRFSDIIELKFGDINNDKIKILQNKTLNEVEIPLHLIAQKILALQSVKQSNDQIFHIPTGGKTSKKLKQWMFEAGISKHLTFHCARHTFGCLLVEKGVNLFIVKKLMGHRKIETTLQYVDKANVDAKNAINTLPNF